MGFVAWLDTETPPADDGRVVSSPHDAAELERHVEIVRSTREAAVPVRAVRLPDDEPERPAAA